MLKLPFRNSLPKPKSHYLMTLSTPFGIMQHTSFDLADPHFGYATDDNARALIAINFWRHQSQKSLPGGQVNFFSEIEERFLKFLKFMQSRDGRFYCFLTYDLKRKELGRGDWFGRTLFALSFIVAQSDRFDKPALSIIWHSLPQILHLGIPRRSSIYNFPLRTRSYLLLAFHYLLKEYQKQQEKNLPKKERILKKREVDKILQITRAWGKDLLERLKKYQGPRWFWPEEKITYDNGKVIQSFFLLAQLLKKEEYLKSGKKLLNFYLSKTLRKGYFQAPGNAHGRFWKKGDPMPLFDEQPIEAYSAITALTSASLLTAEKQYQEKAQLIYQWFFGKNRLGVSLVDKKTGAVHDGLRRKDLNVNKGAESYLSLCLAYFTLKNLLHL